MKGIIILEVNENFEARIKAQFPLDFSTILNLKASDLMNIYTLHRMDKNDPNFFQMEIKEFSVGSFFTGFSEMHYVGRPNYTITVFFSNDEITQNQSLLDFNFEGKLRRIAYEILPKAEQENFDNLLKEYFFKLKNDEIEPYWEEYNKDEISQLVSLPSENSKEYEFNEEIINEKFDTQPVINVNNELNEVEYYKVENEALKAEIESLEMLLGEKDEKINELANRAPIPENSTSGEWKAKYERLEEYNQILTENIDKLTDMSNKYHEEINKQKKNLTELKNKLDSKDTLIDELNRKIEKLTKELEEHKKTKDDALEYFQVMEVLKKESKELKQENEQFKRENEIHLDTIADLKLNIRDLKYKISSEDSLQNNLKEEIIDLKKDIKVLRRERDHYKNIIKEHNLL